MTSNIEPAGSAAVSCPETNGAGAPSCYRVSVISGSLEVSARLKNVDDLELLLKVLEANSRASETASLTRSAAPFSFTGQRVTTTLPI